MYFQRSVKSLIYKFLLTCPWPCWADKLLCSANAAMSTLGLADVFASEEEYAAITHLHPKAEAEQILTAAFSELVDVVATREDADKGLKLCARELNTFMRENYSGFIHSVGRHVYPLILASDYEPGFEGVGSSFTLFLRDGSQYKIAPTAHTDYETYKAVSHAGTTTMLQCNALMCLRLRGSIGNIRHLVAAFQEPDQYPVARED